MLINLTNIDDIRLRQIVEAMSATDKVDLVSHVLTLSERAPEFIEALINLASEQPDQTRTLAAALNLGRFKSALANLTALVMENAEERFFQSLLTENPWMFGSEYSQLLDKRSILSDEQLDFLLRRTVDGYCEIIEIKRPLNNQPLFIIDTSHNNLYPGVELSKAVAQVMKYISTLEAIQPLILARYQLNVSKIKAKLIIGRDVSNDQVDMLRRYNAHLHQIEVITFDQLINIAQRTLDILQGELTIPQMPEQTPDDLSDVPF